jgi:predicted dehydrogenase
MKKIRAVIIGLGRIASLLDDDALREKPCTHSGAIAANGDCILAAGCDIDNKRRSLFAEKWKVPVYADAAEMISGHDSQILVIATHPETHYQYCKLASDCNVPVVICEKPLSDTLKNAVKINRLKNIVIIANHERRYSQDYIRAKDILDSQRLGKIASVRAVLYMGKNRRLLDMLWHDGTHLADAIMFLTSRILKHRNIWGAKLKSRRGTAWLEATLIGGKKDVDIPVIIEIGSGRDHLVFEIEFSCEQGRLRIGNGVFEVWESQQSPYAENFNSLARTSEAFQGPTGYFANMLKDAVCCACDPRRIPQSGAINGLRVIEYLNDVSPW